MFLDSSAIRRRAIFGGFIEKPAEAIVSGSIEQAGSPSSAANLLAKAALPRGERASASALTEAEHDLVLRRLDRMEERILTKTCFYRTLIAANAVFAVLSLGALLAYRAVVTAG